jgi:hypothetical protein
MKSRAAALFSNWKIATHFCYLESQEEIGAIVKGPLRPEVLSMAQLRQHVPSSFKKLPRSDEIERLLTGEHMASRQRRKLVISYFRDRNGQAVIDELLKAGFDVLLMVGNPKDSPFDGRQLETSAEEGNAPRLIQVMDRELLVPLMHVADGVASSAGSQLTTECIHSDIPLLAFYKQNDDEQHLNVELSRLCDKKTQMYGTSFESMALSETSQNSFAKQEMDRFVEAVRSSRISEMYYNHLEGGNPVTIAIVHDDTDSGTHLLTAEDIILGIIHEVQHDAS